MATNKALDFSLPIEELFSEGGFFADGPYEIVRSRFTMFDFNKPNNDTLCLMQVLQPLNSDGEPEGEEHNPRYWPVGDRTKDGTITVEPISPVKGEKGCWSQIRLTDANTYGKLYGKTDFRVFMDHARKAEVDMDAVSNDIMNFDGMKLEFGKVLKDAGKQTAIEKAEDGGEDEEGAKKKYPKETIVITGVFEGGKKSSSKKKLTKKDEDEDEAPKSKKSKKPADDEDEDEPESKPKAAKGKAPKAGTPEAYVAEYLEEEVLTKANRGGVAHLSHRLEISKWASKTKELDKKEVQAIMRIYNDTDDALPAILTTFGWEYDEDSEEIKKSDD